MSTSSSVVQLGAVSSMSGPHSILEVGENNEYKHITKENDTSKSTQQEDTSPNNHLQESDSPSTLPNQPQSAQSNDCVPEDEENTPGADLTSVNKRPPPLEVLIISLYHFENYYSTTISKFACDCAIT